MANLTSCSLDQGIEKTLINEGAGPTPKKGQVIVVHCTGRLSNGTKFWSTRDPGQQPFRFKVGLGQVRIPAARSRACRDKTAA